VLGATESVILVLPVLMNFQKGMTGVDQGVGEEGGGGRRVLQEGAREGGKEGRRKGGKKE